MQLGVPSLHFSSLSTISGETVNDKFVLGQAQQGCADASHHLLCETIEPSPGLECIKGVIKVVDERIADETYKRSRVTGENECN